MKKASAFKLRPRTPVVVVLDFDGTITELDVVDALLVGFAQGRQWIEAEKAWAAGALSSEECLKRQLGSVRITPKDLGDFLKNIPLDPGFKALRKALARSRVPLIVLSDGFDLFIRRYLKLHGVAGVPFRSNALRHAGEILKPSFPHKSRSCGKCGHCKRASIAEIRERAGRVIFAGDGLSDACAARASDVVFAKGKLARFCEDSRIPFIPYKNLLDVAAEIPALLKTAPARRAPREKILRA